MSEMRYPAEIRRAKEGDWIVRFPDLDGALTGGATREEAEAEAADCLASWLAFRLADKKPVPKPSPARHGQRLISVPLWIAPKIALYNAMRDRQISNSELARRLGIRETVVRRMLDPDHATKSVNMERALNAAGIRLFVATEAA